MIIELSNWKVDDHGELVDTEIKLPECGYWVVAGFSRIGIIYEFRLFIKIN